MLAAIGCDLAQGFHYSPPVPAAQLPAIAGMGVAELAPAVGLTPQVAGYHPAAREPA